MRMCADVWVVSAYANCMCASVRISTCEQYVYACDCLYEYVCTPRVCVLMLISVSTCVRYLYVCRCLCEYVRTIRECVQVFV